MMHPKFPCFILCIIGVWCCNISIAIAQMENEQTAKPTRKAGTTYLYAQINAGKLNYNGNTSTKALLYYDAAQKNATVLPNLNPQPHLYGGFSANIRHKRPSNFLIGSHIGLEFFKNKNEINTLHIPTGTLPFQAQFQQQFQYLTIAPYIGYSLNLWLLSVDLQFGIDGALLLKEKYRLQTASNDYPYNNLYIIHKMRNLDIRPRLQINVNFRNKSIYAGWSEGIMPLLKTNNTAQTNAFSSIFRIGFGMQLL